MKKIYKERLDAGLLDRLSGFGMGYSPISSSELRKIKKNNPLAPGERIFGVEESRPLRTFLCIVPHGSRQLFTIEGAWSESGEFPKDKSFSWVDEPIEDLQRLKEGVIRLSDLIQFRSGEPHDDWHVWRCSVKPDHPKFLDIYVEEDNAPVSEAEADQRVANVIDAVLKDLEAHWIPFVRGLFAIRSGEVA